MNDKSPHTSLLTRCDTNMLGLHHATFSPYGCFDRTIEWWSLHKLPPWHSKGVAVAEMGHNAVLGTSWARIPLCVLRGKAGLRNQSAQTEAFKSGCSHIRRSAYLDSFWVYLRRLAATISARVHPRHTLGTLETAIPMASLPHALGTSSLGQLGPPGSSTRDPG